MVLKFNLRKLTALVNPSIFPHVYYSSLPQRSLKNSLGQIIETSQENEAFETFYRAQGICSEEDFPVMMAAARRGLPSVFRVVSTKCEAAHLRRKLNGGFLNKAGGERIDWYPGEEGTVWKLGDNSRWDLAESPHLKEIHKFIDDQRNIGNIYRQEQVSMVPVACLDIQPHHRVLDMCASPGSKTGQVIEALHSNGESCPEGFVIACEPNRQRCSNLVGNMNLMPSPCAMVVCDEGQTFPNIMDRQGEIIKYDRIVCDVPCSGDGTIRKNPNIWESWNPARGNSRFGLQLAIARRGVQLLKVGGLMAYSSCSINQVENEAVVAALLQEAGGSLELVDMEGRFPGLNWLPGLSHWRMFDTEMREYTHKDQVPERYRTQLPTVIFPPSHQTADSLNLHRCMRFLPHLNDDGGFFVAILRKTGEVEEKEARKREKRIEVTHANYKHWAQPKLFHLLDTTANIQFVGDCPRTEMACHQFQLALPRDLLYILRESSTVRLVSPGLAQILHSNNNHLKFAGGPGMQVLRRNTLGEGLEIQQYYIPMQSTYHLLAGLVGAKRKVIGSEEDATRLIYEESVPMDLLSLNVRDRLSALGHGWAVFHHAFPSFTLECLIFSSPNLAMFRLNKRTRKFYTWLLEE